MSCFFVYNHLNFNKITHIADYKMKNKKYTCKDLKVISWDEAVRLRPAMYIGTINNRGFIDMIKGILTSFLSQKKSNLFIISLIKKNKASIQFNNLKAPISENCATIFRNPKPFEIELGVLNALSKKFEILFLDKKNTEISSQKYLKGRIQGNKPKNKEITCNTVKFTFTLDKTIWRENFEWNESYITHEIRDFAYLYKETKFVINYNVGNEKCKIIHHFKNGISDRLKISKLNGLGNCLLETFFNQKINDFYLETAFAIRDYSVDKTFIESYVNDHPTIENGTHVEGLLKGIRNGIRRYFVNQSLDGLGKISKKNVEKNLIAIVNIRLETPSYGGCVKNKLLNSEVINPIADYASSLVFQKLKEDNKLVEKLIQKFEL